LERARHPKKEFEHVLREAESKGWRVTRRAKYFKMMCPCEGLHLKTMHLSPSDPNYLKNLIGQLNRATCWKEQK